MLTQTLPTWLPRFSFAPVNTAPRGDTLVVVFPPRRSGRAQHGRPTRRGRILSIAAFIGNCET
ncbi:MAG: hypothetical protein IPN96_24330 [Anaerolineales bacterium]|nr:hypothetical protein [Anaerolineales bacterium]